MRHGRCDPLERMRALALKAGGNVAALKLKALCRGRRLALLRKPAGAGYLKRIGGGKYLLHRGAPLWEALEQGKATRLLSQLYTNQEPQRRK